MARWYALRKILAFSFLFLLLFARHATAQDVHIPDPIFKAYLIGNLSINTNGDLEIQVSEAEAFAGIMNCNSKNIIDLTGIEAFTKITALYCHRNQLITLDVSKNTALQILYCYENQLTALDVSKNTALKTLHCYNNQLTSLNLKNGNNTALTTMTAYTNTNLSCIQVDNPAYANINSGWSKDATATYSTDCVCPTGDITFSTQQQINDFAATYSHCSSISLNNVVIGYQSGTNDSNITNLTPLQKITSITGELIIRRNPQQTTLNGLQNITSFNGNLRIERNDLLTNISALSGITSVAYLNIRDNAVLANLNGLHNLTSTSAYLYIRSNAKLTSLDALQSLTTIGTYIEIMDNAVLTNLNGLSGVTAINGNINIHENPVLMNISGLRNINPATITNSGGGLTIQNNPELAVCNLSNFCTYLAGSGARTISGNKTTCLDVAAIQTACGSPVVNIPDVNFKAYLVGRTYINTNGDNEIQVSEAEAFTGVIDCSSKNIASLTGIEAFVNLTQLDCSRNQLTTLDVSKNTALVALICHNTQLTSLDISNNTALQNLYCIDNQLTSLNLKNGSAMLSHMWVYNNPNLTCIQVDNVANANANSNWQKDATASYNTDCNSVVYIPDANFKAYLVGNSAINTNGDNEIQVSEAEAFTGAMDCNSKNIADFTGIEAFVNLTGLTCHNNQLTALDISNNTALRSLSCLSNQLTALDVSKNTALRSLNFGDNQLTNIDLTQNTLLQSLYCQVNNLTYLDVSKNTDLTVLYCYSNQLTSLNIKNENNTLFITMRAASNPNLSCIQVDDAAYSNTNWTNPTFFQKDATASYSTDCSVHPDNDNTLYVDINISGGTQKGNNWANAIPQLADVLKWAKQQYDADNTVFDATPLKIYVAKGTYIPLYRADNLDGSNPQDRDNAFVMVKNVQIYGGFAGNETTLEERNYALNPTLLSGDIDGTNGLSPGDAHHVVISVGDIGSALLDGFTVSGGHITSADGNTGITVNSSLVRYERGSGLSLTASTPQIRNVIFTGNRAYAGVVSHSTGSNATFVNTLFTGNTTQFGTVYNASSSPVFINSTFSGNTGTDNANNGVAMRNVTSHPKFYNTIIWGNQNANGSINNIFNSGGASPTSIPEYAHSLVQGSGGSANWNNQYGADGGGNLDADPLFTDAASSDFTLKSGSPAVNTGSNQLYLDATHNESPLSRSTDTGWGPDLAGSPRLTGTNIDMGAYENPDGVLPVRWISFQGYLNDQRRAVLAWKTEEHNVSHYEAERSPPDGRNFRTIGSVAAGGNGSAHYALVDPAPVSGTVYYRIRQVDPDGTFSYSQIISVRAAGSTALSAWPNPARETVSVGLCDEYVGSRVRLISTAGVVLQEITVKEPVFSIRLDGYPAGVYLLHTTDGKVMRVVKE